MTTSRPYLSTAVRRGLESIGAGMLDTACPDQAAAIAWAKAVSDALPPPKATPQARRTVKANAATPQPVNQV